MVVIGIIAILISFLLPTLGRARERASTVACLSNLRQIGQAIIGYTVSNGGKTPPWSTRREYPIDLPPDPIYPHAGPGWIVLLHPYTHQKPDGPLWNCPAWPDSERRVNYFFGSRWMRWQVPLLRSIPITRIKNSTTFVLSGDCTLQNYYPPPFGTEMVWPNDDIDKDDGSQKCLSFYGDPGGFNMHRVGNNVLFPDGHAATFRKFDPSSLTFSPTEMKSWDEIPLP